jgi:predicted PurR-regulated permease PerM
MSEATDPKSSASADRALEPQVRTATAIAVRLGVLVLLIGWCLQIVAPFIGIVVWAFIIAVASTRPYERLAGLLGDRRSLAAALFVLLALLALIVPAVVLSETLVRGAARFAEQVTAGEVVLPTPPQKIAEWPIVGEQLHAGWLEASENLRVALRQLRPQLEAVSQWLLSAAGSAGIALLQFVASLVIAGVLLARSKGRDETVTRFASRLSGDRGLELAALAEGTIRSVVQGILGVALIQSILAGLGFLVVGLPGAGLWALLVLVAAVVQLPVALVMILPVLVVFSAESTGVAVAFLIWSLLVSLVDNVLKPILFGRGARVPAIVIFLGAIGGMLAMGIIGLFVGAVVLALGHQILMGWLSEEGPEAARGAG